MASHFLALNEEKTQTMFSPSSAKVAIMFDGSPSPVSPSSRVDVLGIPFNDRLEATIPAERLVKAARGSERLTLHLIQEVVRALLVGKLEYGCAVLHPRLSEQDIYSLLNFPDIQNKNF